MTLSWGCIADLRADVREADRLATHFRAAWCAVVDEHGQHKISHALHVRRARVVSRSRAAKAHAALAAAVRVRDHRRVIMWLDGHPPGEVVFALHAAEVVQLCCHLATWADFLLWVETAEPGTVWKGLARTTARLHAVMLTESVQLGPR